MDPALWNVLESGRATDTVAVLLRLRPHAATPEGVHTVAQYGAIATARVARGAIVALREHPDVISLKAARELRPDPSLVRIAESERQRAKRTSAKRNPWFGKRGAMGRGVVVGIIDWGIDFTHPNLLSERGGSRIEAIWDQRPIDGGGVRPYGYGRVLTRTQIEAALAARDPFAALAYDPGDADVDDNGTHGTHVTDIAAGTPFTGRGGVAPGADIVFVHLATESTGPRSIGNSVSLLEAIDFISRQAGDRPCVINMSLGSHAGPHDGTTLVEQALDAFVVGRPGRAIVQSAGNYRRAPVHASGEIVADARSMFVWKVAEHDDTTNELDLWYPGADRIAVKLIDPRGHVVARALPDGHGPIVVDGETLGRFAHRTREPNNFDNHVAFVLEPRGRTEEWSVVVEPLLVESENPRWHAWIERDEGGPGTQSRLRSSDLSSASTIGTIANGHHTIVVGAYDRRTGETASFSSAGPTRDGRFKPDILAPGVAEIAARSVPSDGGDELLTSKNGTSMAAPHVAGAIALLYEVGGALPIDEVRAALGIGGGQKLPKLDVRAAVARVKAPGTNAAEIFDAYTVPARYADRLVIPDVEVIAHAGASPASEVMDGDWLIERALGEGGVGQLTVLTDVAAQAAAPARHDRMIVRPRPRRQRAITWRFEPPPEPSGLTRLRAKRRSRPPTEAIDGFVDTPPTGKIDVGRRGLFLRLAPEVRYIERLDRNQQAMAMWIRSLVGDAYKPLLVVEITEALGISIQGLEGLAGVDEKPGGERGGFGTTTPALGLEVVRWLQARNLTILLDDTRLRRLEHAVAVELAWTTVFAQTPHATTDVVLTKVSRAPDTHRHAWVNQAVFTDIAWSLGPRVEALRVAMLAFEAKPGEAGSPEFDARAKAMEKLWEAFNRGADPLHEIFLDRSLHRHPGFAFLFPELVTKPAPGANGHAARVRFIEVCHVRYPALAAAVADRDGPLAAISRKELLDRFAADFKILVDLAPIHGEGQDPLQYAIAEANAPPFASSLRIAPAGPMLPSGAELGAEMSVRADHWLSLWDYRYSWDLLRIDPDGMHDTGTSGGRMLLRRLAREGSYTWTDFQRLRDEMTSTYGQPGLGAVSMSVALGLLRIAGTIIKDIFRAIFERPYEKSLVLPAPGFYVLRCSAGDPDSSGALVRVPSVAYQLLFIVEPKQLAETLADAALTDLRKQAIQLATEQLRIAIGVLEGEELEEATRAVEQLTAIADGSGAALYALQRKNLERALADTNVLNAAAGGADKARKDIKARIDEIDRIVGQRATNLARAVGTPYRVIAILVTDLGSTLHLMVEAKDVENAAGTATVHVVDSTAKHSGWEQRTAATRSLAIRDALLSLLQNKVTGYGRGYCTILVPTNGVTGIGAHDKLTFRVNLDSASLMTELLEGSALVAGLIALLLAPFTAGASLALLIPFGIIGAIPSAYRLIKRNEEGTFAWDMETAMDIVNIASAVLGISQTGTTALRFTRMATIFKIAGHGTDATGIILGKVQFFEELEAIASDESMLPAQRRLAMTMAVANTLLQDGIQIGHMMAMHAYGQMPHEGMDPKRYPLAKHALPEGTELPPIRERTMPKDLEPAPPELAARARTIAKRDVPVLVDPALKGRSAEVRYILDAYGFIRDIYIAVGKGAGLAQIDSHAATAKQLHKFTGVLGKARTLIDWARAFFTRDPSLKVGKSQAWEARVELEKLPKQISDFMRSVHKGLADGTVKPADIDGYIQGLLDQLAEHEAALRSAAAPTGKIAAEDRTGKPSARKHTMTAGREQAQVQLGIEPGALTVRDAPPGQDEIRVARSDDGKVEITVPKHHYGRPVTADDIGLAASDHAHLATQRPRDPTQPDSARPWDGNKEAEYRGRPPAEPGYRWEIGPDGKLTYTGRPPRLFDPASGYFARDPSVPVTPRRPTPSGAKPSYSDDIAPGFFDGIDPSETPTGLDNRTKQPVTLTMIDESPPNRGQVQREFALITNGPRHATVRNSYDRSTAEFSLDVHFFHQEFPTRVVAKPGMVGETAPAAAYFTLRQMRELGIKPGELRRMRLHQIQNVETVMQVHLALKDLQTNLDATLTPELTGKLESTALGLYARTIARQSGHVVVGVELVGADAALYTLGELMTWYESRLGRRSDPQAAKDLHDLLLKRPEFKAAGIDRGTRVMADFDIVLLLEDAP